MIDGIDGSLLEFEVSMSDKLMSIIEFDPDTRTFTVRGDRLEDVPVDLYQI